MSRHAHPFHEGRSSRVRGLRVLSTVALMAVFTVPASMAAPATGQDATSAMSLAAPEVRRPVDFGVSPPLSSLEGSHPAPTGTHTSPLRPLPRPDIPSQGLDPVLQTGGPDGSVPGTSANFEGNADSDNFPLLVNPPDTVGDVGPNHYVQMVNLLYSVYDKSGNRLVGPVNLNMIWAGLGANANCAVNNNGDPVVLYDQLADRWILTQFAFAGLFTGVPTPPYDECIAISQTPDPTGEYYLYDYTISNTLLNDYPKFGVWPDAYYMSINQFGPPPNFPYAGPGAAAFDREAMLEGDPLARMVYFDLSGSLGPEYGGQLPSDLDGTTLPPDGAPNYFIEADDHEVFPDEFAQDQLSMFEFHVDWTTTANSTFTGPTAIPTAPFDSNMCGFARACIPQLDSPDNVDALSDRVMHRLGYRNFGNYQSLVMNHTVDAQDVEDHAGLRWYEVRRPGPNPTIFQQGTYAPDQAHRWMGSVAMDREGNMALGYSKSSAAQHPSINYTGRLRSDPPGTMRAEATLLAGTGSQLASANRWGDYSSMNVDPLDDCTFWYTQEYYASTADFNWRTRIGSFRFPACGDLALSLSDAPDPVDTRGNLTYTATVLSGGTTVEDVTVTQTLPAGAALDSVTPSRGTCDPSVTAITCHLGTMNAGTTATIVVVVRPLEVAVLESVATVTTTSPDPEPLNNTATALTVVQDPCFQPGRTIVTDPTGDALDMVPAHDVQRISVAEPYQPDGVPRLVFTLKVASLSTVPPNTTWPVSFEFPAEEARFVAMMTNAAGQVTFRYGNGLGSGGGVGNLEPGSGFTSDGTITLIIKNSDIPGDPGAGQDLTGFLTRIRIEPAATPDNAPNDLAPTGSYTIVGNGACQPADLGLTKSDSPDPVPAGEQLTYTLNVRNPDPAAATATGVTVYDLLPDTVTFLSATPSQGTCTGLAPLRCSLGSVAAEEGASVTIRVRAPGSPGSITNDAIVVASEPDPDLADNADVETTTVGPAPVTNLTLEKQALGTLRVRQTIRYLLIVRNAGPNLARGVELTDQLPDEVVYRSAQVTRGSGSCRGTETVRCDLGTIPAGVQKRVLIKAWTTTAGAVSNSAIVGTDTNETSTADNDATRVTQVSGRSCTIVGTHLGETLTGTGGADVICGAGGNDTLNGGGGRDALYGLDGNDVLNGGDGDDLMGGGTGNDRFDGGSGNDTVSYFESTPGSGVTVNLAAGTGGGPAHGTDTFVRSGGTATVENLDGTSGNDTLSGNDIANVIIGQAGNDDLMGRDGNDLLAGGVGNDDHFGGAGNDRCSDDRGANTFDSCELRPLPAALSPAELRPWMVPANGTSREAKLEALA